MHSLVHFLLATSFVAELIPGGTVPVMLNSIKPPAPTVLNIGVSQIFLDYCPPVTGLIAGALPVQSPEDLPLDAAPVASYAWQSAPSVVRALGRKVVNSVGSTLGSIMRAHINAHDALYSKAASRGYVHNGVTNSHTYPLATRTWLPPPPILTLPAPVPRLGLPAPSRLNIFLVPAPGLLSAFPSPLPCLIPDGAAYTFTIPLSMAIHLPPPTWEVPTDRHDRSVRGVYILFGHVDNSIGEQMLAAVIFIVLWSLLGDLTRFALSRYILYLLDGVEFDYFGLDYLLDDEDALEPGSPLDQLDVSAMDAADEPCAEAPAGSVPDNSEDIASTSGDPDSGNLEATEDVPSELPADLVELEIDGTPLGLPDGALEPRGLDELPQLSPPVDQGDMDTPSPLTEVLDEPSALDEVTEPLELADSTKDVPVEAPESDSPATPKDTPLEVPVEEPLVLEAEQPVEEAATAPEEPQARVFNFDIKPAPLKVRQPVQAAPSSNAATRSSRRRNAAPAEILPRRLPEGFRWANVWMGMNWTEAAPQPEDTPAATPPSEPQPVLVSAPVPAPAPTPVSAPAPVPVVAPAAVSEPTPAPALAQVEPRVPRSQAGSHGLASSRWATSSGPEAEQRPAGGNGGRKKGRGSRGGQRAQGGGSGVGSGEVEGGEQRGHSQPQFFIKNRRRGRGQ